MELQKYVDMVYNNSTGKRWLHTLMREDIWSQWEDHLKGFLPEELTVQEYAHRIAIETIWYMGYIRKRRNKIETGRCSKRIRRPSDKFGDEFGRRGFIYLQGSIDAVPWEFQEFDNFLENYVRPNI